MHHRKKPEENTGTILYNPVEKGLIFNRADFVIHFSTVCILFKQYQLHQSSIKKALQQLLNGLC